jgi:hypothetical protein
MPKPIKIAMAVLLGLVVWFLVATVANLFLRAALAGYADAERAVQFTLPMLLSRLVVGALSSVAARLACASVMRDLPAAAKVLAIALVLLFIPVHYSLWAQFPLWYHAVFLLSLAPLVMVGAWLVRRHRGGASSAA